MTIAMYRFNHARLRLARFSYTRSIILQEIISNYTVFWGNGGYYWNAQSTSRPWISDNDSQGTVPQGTPYQRRSQVCHSPKGCILTQNLKKITRRSFLYYCYNLWWFDIGSPWIFNVVFPMKVEVTWWKVFGAWQSMSFDVRHWSPSDYSISWPWFFFHELVLSQFRKFGGSKVSSPDLSLMLKNSAICCFVIVEAIPKGAQSTHPLGISNVW